jgi:flagellar basal body P-ring formation protein FlgA
MTRCSPLLHMLRRQAAGLALAGLPWAALGQGPAAPAALAPELGQRITELAQGGARQLAAAAARVEVQVGQLDPRLQLAPCARIEPYLPPQATLWGRTRVGLRCTEGPKRWNVSLPVTVRVWAPALVATADLPAGTVLTEQHLGLAEVDLAAAPGVVLTRTPLALGRTLQRGLAAGDALRQADLKARQWFAAGETVRVVAAGPGWRVVSEGQALGAGLEGQPVRVRMDNGKMLQARPVADRQVEVML